MRSVNNEIYELNFMSFVFFSIIFLVRKEMEKLYFNIDCV
jgi:hypothetical protein